MLKKVSAVYSIFTGISVIGMWTMIILTGGIAEGMIEILNVKLIVVKNYFRVWN